MASRGAERRLARAAESGDIKTVEALLADDVDPSHGDRHGITPLMKSCHQGHIECVRALLAHGAPWNELDFEGHCAGEYASAGGHHDLVAALIEHAVQAELVLGVLGRAERASKVPNFSYLSKPVTYDGDDKLLDTNRDAVMMDWETPLMKRHAEAICAGGGDVLNVGFGMGIFDRCVREHPVVSHTIIEAHPDVHSYLIREGWGSLSNVRVEFGRWQDVVDAIITENDALPGGRTNPDARLFDGVFFDTYGEDYDDLRDFHALLPKIMRKGGVYSYFNGMAPDNGFFHIVYCRLAEAELARIGFKTQFEKMRIDSRSESIWCGVDRRYWWGETYLLPVCRLVDRREDEFGDPEDR